MDSNSLGNGSCRCAHVAVRYGVCVCVGLARVGVLQLLFCSSVLWHWFPGTPCSALCNQAAVPGVTAGVGIILGGFFLILELLMETSEGCAHTARRSKKCGVICAASKCQF